MFKSKSEPERPQVEPADAVQQARTRARQRLIGAVVLLAVGIIGFPLVFETQPRPIPVDIPIEISRKDAVSAPALPGSPAGTGAMAAASGGAATARSTAAAPAERTRDETIVESSADAGRDVTPPSRPARANESAAAASTAVATRPGVPASAAVQAQVQAQAQAQVQAQAQARRAGEAERARALLEARPVAAAPSSSATASDGAPRFVVQVGAFAETDAAREARLRVEKLGLKTYTQVAQTPAGNRIRVRVGPFASRADADAALAKAKGAGLAAVVLTL